jgi:hypothetical protein
MNSKSRAFVALISGQMAQQCKKEEIRELESNRSFTFGELPECVKSTLAERSCGVNRDAAAVNYCLRDPASRAHICLSLYGPLFEGYDHGSASHFSGIVDGGGITLYDFADSDFFSYGLAEK